MSVFKCKICGGDISFEQGASVGVCEFCGSKQTIPRLKDEYMKNMYDRAEILRRSNDYDKATSLYEQILTDDSTDSEVYWSLVLCQYGIEYVEDPRTHKRMPTINRMQYTSIYDDLNYKNAIKYADSLQRSIYEEEAKVLNAIQKKVLSISQNEDPFDVFICYKETDCNGRRTQDSVLANDLYYQLVHEGFKVFFARITLEDKLGMAYEPYIFAALNTAKVMIVIGTKPEYFNSVWVKNEWSRYLNLVKNSNGKKFLIPAYKDMNPYDLPEEFSHLQAQDMSKLGFMQDLIRGIEKYISFNKNKDTANKHSGATITNNISQNVIIVNSSNVNQVLERVFILLEYKKWDEADLYCDKVLGYDAQNPKGYLGKLMAELKVCKIEELSKCKNPIDNNRYFSQVVRFGDDKLLRKLLKINEEIQNRKNLNSSMRWTVLITLSFSIFMLIVIAIIVIVLNT